MEVKEALLTRRSIRKFETEKNISKEDLETLVEVGRYAPSGMNKQTWHFSVIQSQPMIKRLAEAVKVAAGRAEDYDFYAPNAMILVSNERDNHLGMEDNACALENIFVMAHALGIGSVWINQFKGICDDPAVRALLRECGIPENHIIYGASALGYAASPAKEANKKEDVVTWVTE